MDITQEKAKRKRKPRFRPPKGLTLCKSVPEARLAERPHLSMRSLGREFVPPNVCKVLHLEGLDLSWNALSWLPLSIWHLTKLRFLILRGNQFEHVPERVLMLPALEVLDMRNNPIPESDREIVQSRLPKTKIKW